MSLRRNNRYLNRGDTIVRTSPIPTTVGLTTEYYTNRYVKLKNKYFDKANTWYMADDNTIIIKAEIPENANGYFFGIVDSNNSMSIRKDGSVIKWKLGTTEYTRDWEEGIHLYGFSAGKAWYDNTFISTSPYVGGMPSPNKTLCFGAAYNTGTSSYTYISEIDIYELFVVAPLTSSSTSKSIGRLYAVREGVNGTTPYLFEMKQTLDVWESKGSGTVKLGESVTYGVQLHDLKESFGSGYRDLVAMMTEDWPEQAASDADPADVLTGPSSATFNSAFSLYQMPIPTGWSRTARPEEAYPQDIKYAKGDLIEGRIPKWRLWADNINVGKFGRKSGNYYFFNYNIFYPRNKVGRPNLEQWEGYSTNASQTHTPFFDMGDDLSIEHHNGVTCKADTSTRIKAFNIGATDKGTNTTNMDDQRVFKHALPSLGSGVKMGLGNLIDWHKTGAQQLSDQDPSGNNPMYAFSGIAGAISRRYPTGLDEGVMQYATRLIAAAWQQTSQAGLGGSNSLMPLSSNTSSTEIDLFRDGKVNGEYKDWEMNICGTEKDQDLLFFETRKGPVTGEGTLAAIVNMTKIANKSYHDTLTDEYLCRTNWVLPIKKPILTSNNNPFECTEEDGVPTTPTNYRCVLMNETVQINGSTGYIYPLFTYYTPARAYVRTRDISNIDTSYAKSCGGFVFMFSLLDKPIGSPDAEAINIAETDFRLSLELVTVNYKLDDQGNETDEEESVTRSFKEVDFVSGEPKLPDNTSYFAVYDLAYTLRPYQLNSVYIDGGSGFINPMLGESNSVDTICKGIFISAYDLPPEHVREDEVSTHLTINRNTTVRMWIYPKTHVVPRVKVLGAPYDWTEAMYKKLYYGTGANTQTLLYDRTSLLALTAPDSPINLHFYTQEYTVLDIPTFNGDLLTGSLPKYPLRIDVYKNWQEPNTLNPADILCSFSLYRRDGGLSETHYGYIGFGNNNGQSVPWLDSKDGIDYELEMVAGHLGGMQVRISLIGMGTGVSWGNNNLTINVYKDI